LLAIAHRIEQHQQRTLSLDASCAAAAHSVTAQLLSQTAEDNHEAWPL